MRELVSCRCLFTPAHAGFLSCFTPPVGLGPRAISLLRPPHSNARLLLLLDLPIKPLLSLDLNSLAVHLDAAEPAVAIAADLVDDGLP